MSKRRNPTSVEYYRRAGYLSDALLNYLALMAYPPLGEEEKFSFEQLAESFDPDRISLGGSIFDIEKLNWLNGRYLREERTPEQILDELKSWLLNDEYIAQIVPLLQQRMETLGDFIPKAAFFLAREVDRGVAEYWQWPVRDITVPLTVAMVGTRVGPPLFEAVVLLGQDLMRMRLIQAMNALGGLSKKKAAKLEKEWKKPRTVVEGEGV